MLSLLKGRRVVLWPDSDDVGRAHMHLVAERLRGIAASVSWLEPPDDVPKGWDAADALSLADDTPAVLRPPYARVRPVPEDAERPPMTEPSVLGVRRLDAIPTAPPPDLLVGWLDPEGHTVLLGDGGVGKGTIAAHFIVELVKDGELVPVIDYEDHPTEWARRVAGLGGLGVLESVYHVAPLAPAWTGPRGAIWAQAQQLREAADQVRATYVVIDSIVVAARCHRRHGPGGSRAVRRGAPAPRPAGAVPWSRDKGR